jgi:hypothetical protein
MKPLWAMTTASVVTALVIAVIPGFDSDRELVFGMLAPLAGAALTWVMAARLFPANPERLTSMMMATFLVKIVFFGAYVAIMLKVVMLQPMPFVASFTAYFITLHIVEALYLQRLFAGRV